MLEFVLNAFAVFGFAFIAWGLVEALWSLAEHLSGPGVR